MYLYFKTIIMNKEKNTFNYLKSWSLKDFKEKILTSKNTLDFQEYEKNFNSIKKYYLKQEFFNTSRILEWKEKTTAFLQALIYKNDNFNNKEVIEKSTAWKVGLKKDLKAKTAYETACFQVFHSILKSWSAINTSLVDLKAAYLNSQELNWLETWLENIASQDFERVQQQVVVEKLKKDFSRDYEKLESLLIQIETFKQEYKERKHITLKEYNKVITNLNKKKNLILNKIKKAISL